MSRQRVCLPNSDVEDVATDRTRYCHITETLSCDDDACDEVGNTGTGSQERQAHHFRWYTSGITNNVRPPDHQVRVSSNPYDRPNKRYREEFFS